METLFSGFRTSIKTFSKLSDKIKLNNVKVVNYLTVSYLALDKLFYSHNDIETLTMTANQETSKVLNDWLGVNKQSFP